jgi:hypothetical protein
VEWLAPGKPFERTPFVAHHFARLAVVKSFTGTTFTVESDCRTSFRRSRN